jgi:hypothetical protein
MPASLTTEPSGRGERETQCFPAGKPNTYKLMLSGPGGLRLIKHVLQQFQQKTQFITPNGDYIGWIDLDQISTSHMSATFL